MREALKAAGQSIPSDQTCPTGADLFTRVFNPISKLPKIHKNLQLGARVRAIGRQGLLKHEEIASAERAARPFRLLVESEGLERYDTADIVLDCTGASVPNALGDGGIPALGESVFGAKILHDVPDLSRDAEQWKGQTVLLAGGGHSAQTAARDLVSFARRYPGTEVVWIMRDNQQRWTVSADDPLPARAALIEAASALLENPPPCMRIAQGVTIRSMRSLGGRLEITLQGSSNERIVVDKILALTGRVGDHSLYRQLQVHECYATSGPMKLAAALLGSGSSGDCMKQESQGADTLLNPEPGFFILGSKSYGRRTDFLLRVGWQQVDEAFQLLHA